MSPCPPRGTDRGYVLVLVVLLVLVIGLFAGVGAQRLGSQSLSVRRQLDRYQAHHAGRGLQDAIETWMQGQRSNDIWSALDDDGFAFEITFQSGSNVRVYLSLGQSTALGDLSLVEDDALSDAARVLQELNASVSEAEFRRLTRKGGPAAVDVVRAEDPVLRAVAMAVTGNEAQAETLFTELAALRAQDEEPDENDLEAAASATGLDADRTAALQRLATTAPELWLVTVVQRSSRGDVTARYAGLTLLRTGRGNTGSGRFLTWGPLEEDTRGSRSPAGGDGSYAQPEEAAP